MEVKKEFRIIGIDDGHFVKGDEKVLIVGTIFRGGQWMDGVVSTEVDVDGRDATEKLIKLVKGTKHSSQLKCIMLNGIAIGGFNVVDIQDLNRKTKLPVIVVIRKIPDFKKIKRALEIIGEPNKMDTIMRAGEIHGMPLKDKAIHFQIAGISKQDAEKIIRISATRSLVPEPIRAAHIIASGVTLGESSKRV